VAGRLAAAGRGDAAAPLYLESLRLTCDYLAGRRPEHAERLRTLGEAMNGERPAAADLREIAEVCRQVAPGLLDLWGAGVDGLESVWRETRPEGAAACRAARTAVGPIPGLDPPPSGRSL
jgi:hypothetical protein